MHRDHAKGFATALLRYSRVGYMMQEGTLETEMLRHYQKMAERELELAVIAAEAASRMLSAEIILTLT